MSNERPSITEKIKFWEEQDKINQAFIPRVIEMSESLQKISKQSLKNSTKVTDQATKTAQIEKDIKKINLELKEISLKIEKITESEQMPESLNTALIATAVIALVLSILSLVL